MSAGDGERMREEGIAGRLGRRVRALRTGHGWTRAQLAGRARVSERYLAMLERGDANVTLGVLARLADAFALSPAELLDGASASGPGPHAVHAPLVELLASATPAEQRWLHARLGRELARLRADLRGVALIGLRGAGKSTLGRRLADRFGMPFVRLTAVVEELAGMAVGELFSLGGEAAYRRLESEALARVCEGEERVVLETAGGIVHNPEAYEMLLARYRTVWIAARPEEHMERVRAQGDLRPMRGVDRAMGHLVALLRSREPLYARADFRIDTGGRGIESCLAELATLVAPVFGTGADGEAGAADADRSGPVGRPLYGTDDRG